MRAQGAGDRKGGRWQKEWMGRRRLRKRQLKLLGGKNGGLQDERKKLLELGSGTDELQRLLALPR